jgi:formylglycine-generating enzyme required for sulfatase activity
MKIHEIQASVRCLTALYLGVWAFGPNAAAQPAQVSVQTYAGLTLTGTVGTVYSIEYLTDLSQTSTWRCLEFLQPPATNYLWFDSSTPVSVRRFYRAVRTQIPTNMVFIPPGTFRMGSPTNEVDRSSDEGPQTAVIISRGFWMGQYLVTQGEYLALMGTNPSSFTGDLSRPVETLTWYDATNYCWALTQQERSAALIPTNSIYRLPTEAEWEYACRAWTSTRFGYGDDPGYLNLTNYAWFGGDSSGTQPVGQKLPNLWGLYDMHGNASGWCQDWYGPYAGGIALDPQGPATGIRRVYRGGNWALAPWYCHSATREQTGPETKGPYFGLRVVLAAHE